MNPNEPKRGDSTPEAAEKYTPSMAGAICVALRAIGMQNVNVSSPDLKRLIDANVDIGTFVEMGKECVAKQKPFAYLLAAVRGRMADSANVAEYATARFQPRGGVLAGAI